MKKSFQIFRRDIKRLARNKAAVLVMIGVCILPSLYAWFNIAANMDPYSNTSGILVAVANNDSGAKNDLLTLNAGAAIEEQLKENDQLGWTFVEEKEAIQGVRSGKYYAAIIIPKDFSSSLLSVLSGNPEKAELDYYINEKKNAIAPKITDTGAGTIQQEINDTFSSTAAKAVSDILQSSAIDVTGDLGQVNTNLLHAVTQTRDNLADYHEILADFQTTADRSNEAITNTLASLDAISDAAGSGVTALSDTTSLLSNSRSTVSAFAGQFVTTLSDGETLFNDMYLSATTKLGLFESRAEQVTDTLGNSISSAQDLAAQNQELLDALEALHRELGNDNVLSDMISDKIAELEAQNASFRELLSALSSGNSSVAEALASARTTRSTMESLTSQNKETLRSYRNRFEQTTLLQLNQSLDDFATLNGTLKQTLSDADPSVQQMKQLLLQLQSALEDSTSALEQTAQALSAVTAQLDQIVLDLQALQSSGIYQQLLTMDGIDSTAVSDFMASPVSIRSEVLYDVENYGSAMTPFYTNLALWVGGLILVSILKLEVDKDQNVSSFSSVSAYFGRWLLFIAAALVQGLIVCLGDLYLLNVQCLHPVIFVLTGMFCSFVYVNLIYALAVTFRHIGKALGVLLVILQIPGSSGTYPIEMTPEFFQRLHPFLPFTYGIQAMRESIAGMYGGYLTKYLCLLALFLPIAFLIGLGFRPLLFNLNHLFDRKLEATGFMLCETADIHKDKTRFSILVRTLLQDEAWKSEYMERSARFEKRYPRLVTYGFVSMLVIPLLFLILMFSLESKLVFLILWILSLIILSVYLICVEYIHDRIRRRINLTELSTEALIKQVKEEQNR